MSGFPTGVDWNHPGSCIDLGSGVLAIIRSMEKARGLLVALLPPVLIMSEPAGWLPEAGGEPRIPAGRRRGPSIISASTAEQQRGQGTVGREPEAEEREGRREEEAAPYRPAGEGIMCWGSLPPKHGLLTEEGRRLRIAR